MASLTKNAESPQGLRSERTRVRIQAIDIQLKTTNQYPIFLEFVIDGTVRHKLPRAAPGQHLQWKLNIAFDIAPKSVVNVKVREVHALFTRTSMYFTCSGQDVIERWLSPSKIEREFKVSQNGSSMTMDFASISSAVNLVATEAAAGKAAEATEDIQSILSDLGQARSAVETIMGIMGKLAEIHPVAKAAFTAINSAFEHIQEQETYDINIRDLALGMTDMLSFVKFVQERAKILQLKEVVLRMLKLIEDASHFIVDYLSHGRFKRSLKSTSSSQARTQIDEFIKKFNDLKNQFDRGLDVQVLDTVMTIQEESALNKISSMEESVLAKLHSMVAGCGPSYDDERTCMDGTRQKVLHDIEQWTADPADSQSLLWIHGLAGSGKSSLASSVCKRLYAQRRLGATFFCKRDDPYLRDPKLVVPRIASRLASMHRPFGKALAAALQEEPNLATEDISLQFRGLIQSPLMSAAAPVFEVPYVIVVDALDECITSDNTRKQLLSILLEIAYLVPWLKVIITSRPEPQIQRFFLACGQGFRPLNIDHEDPSNDILTFVTERMKEIARDNSLPLMWPGTDTTQRFARRAGRLFVWARVASDFVAKALDPQRNLGIVLAEKPGLVGRGPYAHLDLLYKTALAPITDGDDQDAEIFREVVGAIVAISMRDPLPVKGINTLFADEDIGPAVIDSIIRHLQSVLYEDRNHGNSVRLCHPSFSDFLTDKSRCGKRFYIDLKRHSAKLTCMCVRTMISGLKFNICGLKSSHQFNADIIGLKDLVDSTISKGLSYSCIHWHSHLSEASKDEGARTQIFHYLEEFFSHARPLYWLEALSLLAALPSAIYGLPMVVEWLENPETDCSRFATDILRFVSSFYEPISRSAPHLYVSALPFAPRRSIIFERLHPLFPNTISLKSGQEAFWSACLHISEGHSRGVMSVDVSPDGRKIVSGSQDKTIRLWDAKTGEVVSNPLEGHSKVVISVNFSPDSQKIVSGSSDNTIRIWNAETGAALLSPLQGHVDSIMSVRFSPDGLKIVSGSRDKTIRIWDAETGMAVSGPLTGHSGAVTSISFSPDGQKIASGSHDATIQIWNAETGVVAASPFKGHLNSVTSVSFSPDGRKIVSGSRDKTVRIWDAETGAIICSPLKGHSDKVMSVRFSPDGQKVVSGSWDATIRIWNAETGASVSGRLEGHSDAVTAVSFSPDGQTIVSGSYDNTLRIWNAEMGAAGHSPVDGHSRAVISVSFSPDGQKIVSGSDDNTLRIWDANTGASISKALEGHSDTVMSVSFSPDGRKIVSGSRDKSIRIWDAETGMAVSGPFQGHSGVVRSVNFSSDGRKIVSGSFDTTIRIWNAQTGAAVLSPLRGHSDVVRSVGFSPDGRKIVSGSRDQTIRIWDAETGMAIAGSLAWHSNAVTSVSFSPDGGTIVSASFDNTIRLWNAETGVSVSAPLKGHSDAVMSAGFSPDGRTIVSGSFDNTLRLWDAQTGAMISHPLNGHSGGVRSVSYSLDGKKIVSGSEDKTIRVWDAEQAVVAFTSLGGSSSSDEAFALRSFDKISRKDSGGIVPFDQVIDPLARVGPDGWMRQSQDAALLLWVPFMYRQAFVDQSVTVMPPSAAITIDFSTFRHGTSWSEVHG